MYDPKTKMHHCDACGRTMNPTDNLTDMRLAPVGSSASGPDPAPSDDGGVPGRRVLEVS